MRLLHGKEEQLSKIFERKHYNSQREDSGPSCSRSCDHSEETQRSETSKETAEHAAPASEDQEEWLAEDPDIGIGDEDVETVELDIQR